MASLLELSKTSEMSEFPRIQVYVFVITICCRCQLAIYATSTFSYDLSHRSHILDTHTNIKASCIHEAPYAFIVLNACNSIPYVSFSSCPIIIAPNLF